MSLSGGGAVDERWWLKQDDIHWAYFIALEDDLIRLSRFINIDASNFAAHSMECTRLILASCSEIEVVLKRAAGLGRGKHLADCHGELGHHAPLMDQAIVDIPRSKVSLHPWAAWSPERSPDWWKDHNAIKHDRSANFQKATLGNALLAVSGLLVALLVYLRGFEQTGVSPPPRLFRPRAPLGRPAMEPAGPFLLLRDE